MRTALVTGGTGGLGAAVTSALLEDGWRVVVPYVEERELRAPPAAGRWSGVEPHERLTLTRADLLDPASVAEAARAATADPDSPLGAVVNLVGGFASGPRLHETPVDDFEAMLRLNLRPTYLVTQAALPHLLQAGGGAIVCVSARPALRPFSGAAGYVTAKAAVLALVDALAVEYRDDGIRANAVLPSVIDTPGNRAAMPDADHDRWVEPEEIASVIRFLCGPDSTVVSGAHVPVYGRA